MEELKSCPFCGGEAKMHHIGNEYTKSRKVVVKCTKCRVQRTDAARIQSMNWLEKVAIDQWNKRVIAEDKE